MNQQRLEKLQEFGVFLDDVRRRLHISTDLLAAEVKGSKRMFNDV